MKLGIITFHRAINYGAVLQGLALQKALEKLNVDVDIVDYRCRAIEEDYKNIRYNKGTFAKDIINSILCYFVRKRKKNNFREFCNRNMNISNEAYYSKDDLIRANEIYDLFVTGSDQVWDNKCAKFDESYFLTFVDNPKKKNSYAASYAFGDIPQGLEDEYKNRLKDFNNISIREKGGQKIFQNLLKRDVHVDLDPTLLLSKDEWEKYLSKSTEVEKYILLYNVNVPKGLFEYAQRLSKELNCKIVYINDSFKKKVNAEYKKGIGPDEFLSLFANAEYVLTNSFHGTVFSIIFEKKFMVEVISKSNKVNHRSKNLLEALNLGDRICSNIDKDNWNKEINYIEVKDSLNKMRDESIKYLRSLV